MLNKKLKKYNIILASASPRRKQFLKTLGLDFETRIKPIDESFPEHLKKEEISDYLSILKAKPFLSELQPYDILITSDTIVWHKNKALGKPKTKQEAFNMIDALNADSHEVITSVSLTSKHKHSVFNANTTVTFTKLTHDEIWYYINTYKPFDKAGAYGIQEWIGQVGVTKIQGSYFNVMGFPVHLVYSKLNEFIT